jgi:hypothetical protein
VLVPVPVDFMVPGKRVNVHMPVAGNPLRTTLPDGTVHVGWMIFPTNGAVGVAGCRFITTLDEAVEVHPAELVTVKL